MSVIEAEFVATAERTTAPSMRGEFIVCFAKDWQEHPTSNNHVMRMLAKRLTRAAG